MTEKKNGPGEEDLLAVLLEKNVLSRAQVEVAKIDIAATGLSPSDVLLARKWITEQALNDLSPSIGASSGSASKSPGSGSTASGLAANDRWPADAKSAAPRPPGGSNSGQSAATGAEQIYLENLRKYRQLMSQIMGETE